VHGTRYAMTAIINSQSSFINSSAVQLYEYSVYGQVAASDPNHPNPFLFTGRRFDTDTGLYYYRARYYNPYLGRFLQTDPIGYGGGMNVYCYGRNNPVVLADCTGMKPEYVGYAVEKTEICWPGNTPSHLITTIITWRDSETGTEYGSPYQHVCWEEWVGFMASEHTYGQLLVDPEKSGPGWKLVTTFYGSSEYGTRLGYWSIRALKEIGLFSDENIRQLEEKYVTINVKGEIDVRKLGWYGVENRIDWSMKITGRSQYAKEIGHDWPEAMSPLAALAHELTHAFAYRVRGITNEIVQEAHAITAQNLTMALIRSWNPGFYDDAWSGLDWWRPNPYMHRITNR